MLSVIIVAAGSSNRMGFDKLMATIGEKPVLWHTVQAFLNAKNVAEVILVTTKERFDALAIPSPKLKLATGGKDRHNSVANGITLVSKESKMIAVHDGARPLISKAQIGKVLMAAHKHGAATSARKITETVKRSDKNQFSRESIDRENLWLMETPQIFDANKLKEAYTQVEKLGLLVTDEVSAMENIGIATLLVENTSLRQNIKITYPHDLKLAEVFLTQSEDT